jgi:metal-dependent hydrolase (beta-lactamase superfamily II)
VVGDLTINSNNRGELLRVIGDSGNVGIGTTNPTEKLAVNGKIRAKEVIVDTGWSDYVFAKNYKLASLSEVEQHIQTLGHLPGVPSAQEVAEKGVSVGDMQAVLLAKIEELTLHVIAQQKELSALRAKVTTLEIKNEPPSP